MKKKPTIELIPSVSCFIDHWKYLCGFLQIPQKLVLFKSKLSECTNNFDLINGKMSVIRERICSGQFMSGRHKSTDEIFHVVINEPQPRV